MAGDSSGLQQACYGNVLIDIGPMNTLPAADKTPVSTLVCCRLYEAWKPRQRGSKLATVRQNNNDAVICHRHIDGARIELNGRNGHSTPHGMSRDVRASRHTSSISPSANSARSWMNSKRASGLLPIRRSTELSVFLRSSSTTTTRNNVRFLGSMVVSLS